jgi:hypothetical protein
MRSFRSLAALAALAALAGLGCGGRTSLDLASPASGFDAGTVVDAGLDGASPPPPPGDASSDASADARFDASGPSDSGVVDDAPNDVVPACPPPSGPSDCPDPGDGTTVLACNRLVPSGIAVDGCNVYWADHAAGAVLSVPIGGGAVRTLASGLALPTVGATDGAWVYWTDGTLGTVNRVPVTGGAVVTLATGHVGAQYLAIDATNVYWGDNYANGGLYAAPLAGSSSARYLAAYGYFVMQVAVDGPNVLFQSEGVLASVPIDGGKPVRVSTPSSDALAVYGGEAYWVEPAGVVSDVWPGGTPTVLGAVGTTDDIAVDAMGVYGTGNGVVYRLAPDGTVHTLATHQDLPGPIVVDATSVYWTDFGPSGSQGTIMKAPK